MAKNDQEDSSGWVVLGRIVRAQGLSGGVRVLPYGVTSEITAMLGGKRLYLRPPRKDQAQRETVLEYERWHRGTWIVVLSTCRTRDEAESLVGWELCLREEERPALGPDEFYDDQLTGLRVADARTGETLGVVVRIVPAAAADLLEVERPEGRRFLIPLARALIKEVDLSSHTIRVDLPQGLMEVNW